MQSNSHINGSKQPALQHKTVGELLRSAADRNPDHTAVISSRQGIRLSYRELDEKASIVTANLKALGLASGDRIGIWSPNNIEWVVTMYAAARAGLILVNINPAYRVSELSYALNKVGCRALVMAPEFKSSDYLQMMKELAPELESAGDGELHSEALPSLRQLFLIRPDSDGSKLKTFDDLLDHSEEAGELPVSPPEVTPDSAFNIQFTSGTTGSPKGATLTHHNIVNNAFFVGRGIGLSDQDKVCSPVPLYHCFGMVMATLACANHGATLVLPDASFEPESTLKAVAEEQCTALYGVPTMFNMILNSTQLNDYDVSSLRTGIVAGSLCPESLMNRIIDDLNMTEVTNCYGMTETSPVSFQTARDDNLKVRTTTVGSVHPHVEVKVINKEGNIVPRGTRGELCVRGYSVMQGYWNDSEKTAHSIIDGWMHSGDEAVIDDQGYCAIVGRIKDTIIRGGENIAPKEIEEFLLSHDSIIEAQAFGVSDAKFGEIVAVWLMLKDGSSIQAEDVREFCRGQIAHFKVPEIIEFVDAYPMTVTGKVQKFVMRADTEKRLGLN